MIFVIHSDMLHHTLYNECWWQSDWKTDTKEQEICTINDNNNNVMRIVMASATTGVDNDDVQCWHLWWLKLKTSHQGADDIMICTINDNNNDFMRVVMASATLGKLLLKVTILTNTMMTMIFLMIEIIVFLLPDSTS